MIQGIKDRSEIREGEVIRKQGCRDEGETRKDPETGVSGMKGRSGEDPGKIHGSRGFSVQECREWEKSGETRTTRCPKGEGNRGGQWRGSYRCLRGE